MGLDSNLEELITSVRTYDRRRCIRELAHIDRPKLDFTDDFLVKLDIEHLRHVLLAAFLQAQKSLDH